MSCWYNEPRDGFSRIGALIDGADGINSKIEFSEGIFKLDASSKTIHCYLYATAISDIKKSGETGWKFEPQAVFFEIRSEKYEKSAGKGKTTEIEPREFTKWLYRELEAKMAPDGKCSLGGWIYFNEPLNSGTANMIASGKDQKGNELTPTMIDFFASNCFSFEPCQLEKLDPQKLPDLSSKGGKAFSGAGYGRSQDERDRLQDRWAFTQRMLGVEAENIPALLSKVGSI